MILRQILRQQRIILAGLPLQDLSDPIQPEDLRQATQATLKEWWAPMLADPTRLRSREYPAYATLTMCRIWNTLRNGVVATKSETARWAQADLDQCSAGVIMLARRVTARLAGRNAGLDPFYNADLAILDLHY